MRWPSVTEAAELTCDKNNAKSLHHFPGLGGQPGPEAGHRLRYARLGDLVHAEIKPRG